MDATIFSKRYFRCGLVLILTIVFGKDQSVAQQRVDPAVRARLDREFAEAHPQPGDFLPNIELHKLESSSRRSDMIDEPNEENLRYASHGDLTLVITASLTCPKTRQHLPAIQRLKEKFKEELGITIVYVVEAHPEKDICPYLGVVDVTDANLRDNILFRQPKSMAERIAIAGEFKKRYPLEGQVLIDSMDNKAWRTLGQSPNLALLVDVDKRVLLRQGWVEPKSLEEEIVKRLIKNPSNDGRMRMGGLDAYGSSEKGFGGTGRGGGSSEDQNANPELITILTRLSPDYPNTWDFVRWLEKVESDKLRLLFERFPSIANEKLIFGPYSSRETTILQLMINRNDLEKVKIEDTKT